MIRSLLTAYAALIALLLVVGRPWTAAPLCLIALLSIGTLWLRALPGTLAETAIPAVRGGLTAIAGLVTVPLVALVLHAWGAPVRPGPLIIGCAALATALGTVALLRPVPDSAEEQDRKTPAGYARSSAAVAVPVILAVTVGGAAVHGYRTGPSPAEPGYLSIALNGWAAAIDRPVTVPARGLAVPIRVASAGLAEITGLLQLSIGGQVVDREPMTVAADTIRFLTVHVPAPPPDGLLRAVDISIGDTSAGFYARSPAVPHPAAQPQPVAPARTGGRARTTSGPAPGSWDPKGSWNAGGSWTERVTRDMPLAKPPVAARPIPTGATIRIQRTPVRTGPATREPVDEPPDATEAPAPAPAGGDQPADPEPAHQPARPDEIIRPKPIPLPSGTVDDGDLPVPDSLGWLVASVGGHMIGPVPEEKPQHQSWRDRKGGPCRNAEEPVEC